jgi:hypothetical protein
MLSTFYKQEIGLYDRHVPFIQFEVISDLIYAKDKISKNDYCNNLNFILTSDMDDIEHYVDSNLELDLDEYLRINVFFIKSLFRDLKKDSRNFYVDGNFLNLLDSYEDKERVIEKKFIKYMKTKVNFYMDCYDEDDNIFNGNQGIICDINSCVVM